MNTRNDIISSVNSEISDTVNSDKKLMDETIECLMKTFTEKNNSERQKAENKLRELGLASSDLKDDLKLSVILYLKNSIRSRLEKKSFTNDEIMSIVNIFLDVILTGGLNDKLIQNLNLTFVSILNSSYITQNSQMSVDISQFLLNYVKKDSLKEGIQFISTFKPTIMLLQTTVSSMSTNNENVTVILTKHIEIVEFMIDIIASKLRTFSIKDDPVIYISCIDLVRLILDYLFLSLLKLKKMDMLDTVISVYVNKFLIFSIDALSCSNSTQFNFILFTEDIQVDNSLNSMKAKALQLISFIIQNEGNIIKNNFVIENLSKVVNISISSLNFIVTEKMDYISNMSKDNKNYPDNNYDSLMFQIMLFLSRFLAREPIITQFTGFVKNFFLTIIFPILLSTQQERCLMIVEGEEYHNKVIDIILNHKGKSYKVAASFLLTKLCEKYDGLSSFIINICFELIDFCMNGSNFDLLTNYHLLSLSKSISELNPSSTLENVSIQKILTTISAENLIDISFGILLILNNYVNKNTRFMGMLRLILETHSDKIFTINSDIIRDKLCLVLGIFLDELYKSDEIKAIYIHLGKIFEFLFSQILNFNKNQGTAYNASYSLCQLLYYKDFTDITNNIIRKLMPSILEGIKEIEVVIFFDVLVDIVLYIDIEDSLLQICKEVSNRILREIKSSRNLKGKELNVYISKCFHILRTILEKNSMLCRDEQNKSDVEVVIETDALEINEFEKIIQPVVSYIKNVNKIDFDDEIVYLMVNLMQNAKRITNLSKEIFPYFQSYIIKYEGITEEMFELLNLYIIYDDKNYLIEDADTLVNMTNIIKTGMEENEENENSPIFASLLTQAWLQSNYKIPDNCVIELINYNLKELESIYNIYQDTIDQLESSFDVYLFTTFLSTVYSSMINYPYLTLKKLDDLQIFPLFITWTELFTTFGFFSTYQSKVIILGISSILSNNNIIANFTYQLLEKFLFFLFSFLIKQKNAESKKLKAALKNELECNFIMSDEEDENDEVEDEGAFNASEMKKLSKKIQKMNNNMNFSLKEEKQMLKLISKLKSPSQHVDEYDRFSSTLHNLNNFNSQVIIDFSNKLNDAQKFMWNEILHTRRIQVNYSGIKMDVPRRTVKIKRNDNTSSFQ